MLINGSDLIYLYSSPFSKYLESLVDEEQETQAFYCALAWVVIRMSDNIQAFCVVPVSNAVRY